MDNSKVEQNLLPIGLNPGLELHRPNRFGVRHVQGLLLFFGVMASYFLRVNVSASIVPMTKTQNNNTAPNYNWDSSTKSLILSSFFLGYTVMQFSAGILASRYGVKIVYSLAMIAGSGLTMLGPLAANVGNWQLFLILRVLVGLTQGVAYPCTHTMLSKWAPKTERGFLLTAIYSGAQLGTVIILAVSGPVFNSSMGWPALFYISGTFSLIWSFIFLIFGCNEPSQSKVIKEEEKQYIMVLTGSSITETPKHIPFRSILTSGPFLALIAAQCSSHWGFFTLLTEIPNYLSNAMNLNVKSNGIFSALPYFAMFVCSYIVGPISDLLVNNKILKVDTARKVFSSIGQWVPMTCLITLGFLTIENQAIAIVLLTVCVGFNAAIFCGIMINHIDLSPNFAGTLMGIANGVSSISSIIAPLLVGALVEDESDPSQWRIIFFISASIYLLGNGIFIIFGRASIQPWNSVVN